MHARRLTALLLASLGVLTACGGDASPRSPSLTASTSAPTPVAPSSGGLFVSTTYHYTITSRAWSGLQANQAWDGAGAPGSADPTVDRLYAGDGDDAHTVFVYGGPTSTTLRELVSNSRSVGAAARGCSAKPEATALITVSGERAVLDETHCNGVFALNAYVVSAGRGRVFFTFDQPGHESAMRAWFGSLLEHVSFAD
jgi:hypothetical protein